MSLGSVHANSKDRACFLFQTDGYFSVVVETILGLRELEYFNVLYRYNQCTTLIRKLESFR